MAVFFLDENVNRPTKIIERCAELGIEVVRAHDLDLDQTPDEDIFDVVMELGYVIITGNIEDFRPLQEDWIEAGNDFPGVIYLASKRYRNVNKIIATIELVNENYQVGGEWWLR